MPAWRRFCFMNQHNIFLVGLMAVGKSTVGYLLADTLSMPFYDSDQEIEKRAGAEISWIFDVEGEAGFREREEQVIDDLTQMSGVVVATGGGAVKSPINRQNLASRGVVIHLDCTLHRLVARTQHDKKRPLLQGGNTKQILDKLMGERGPLYAEIADYRFVTDKQSANTLVQTISKKLREDGIS
jgi:shikimate kinase